MRIAATIRWIVTIGVASTVGCAVVVAGWMPSTAPTDRLPEAGDHPHAPDQSDEPVTSSDVLHTPSGDHAPWNVWGVNRDGRPIRWNPCQPIRLVLNSHGAPEGWLNDLEEAIRQITAASLITFEIEGTTAETPTARRPLISANQGEPRWAPVLVAWATPSTSDGLLSDRDRGVAIPVAVGTDHGRVFVTGQVVFNAARSSAPSSGDLAPLTSGFTDRATSWGATILHELLHLVGLDHVDDPTQLMYGPPGHGPVELGDGDRAGLVAVAGDPTCLAVPSPSTAASDAPRRTEINP